eukprot:scaffold32404_cov27-Attheya_sp.AAC.1
MLVKCPYFTELESLTKSHQVSPSLTKSDQVSPSLTKSHEIPRSPTATKVPQQTFIYPRVDEKTYDI